MSDHEKIFLEDLLEQAAIRRADISPDEVKKELTNLTLYRNKQLAHAESSPSPDTWYPRTEILAKLAHGFYVILLQVVTELRNKDVYFTINPCILSFDEIVKLYQDSFKDGLKEISKVVC